MVLKAEECSTKYLRFLRRNKKPKHPRLTLQLGCRLLGLRPARNACACLGHLHLLDLLGGFGRSLGLLRTLRVLAGLWWSTGSSLGFRILLLSGLGLGGLLRLVGLVRLLSLVRGLCLLGLLLQGTLLGLLALLVGIELAQELSGTLEILFRFPGVGAGRVSLPLHKVQVLHRLSIGHRVDDGLNLILSLGNDIGSGILLGATSLPLGLRLFERLEFNRRFSLKENLQMCHWRLQDDRVPSSWRP